MISARLRSIRNARASGFTLIEVLVAMGILVVGVSSILGLLMFGAALQRTSERRNESSLAANQVVAALRATAFKYNVDGSTSEPSNHIEMSVPDHPRLNAVVDLKKNPTVEGEYFATIQIQWHERGESKTEEFRTILERAAPFTARVEYEYRHPVKKP
ncbi:MAG: prepilin-type N-terminal cleavage/methylation domain-containing protein [Planctomycetes bacterium]|nr:prepilin-type N-terminal cleavage/methylation domain-containing protein [Planctomycetota bacterium]